MSNRSKLYIGVFLITTIALASAGCGNQRDEEAFLSALNTAIAGTDTAKAAALQQTAEIEAAFTPTETTTPTSTDTLTPKPANTSTPPDGEGETITVKVSLDTNCRSGPGKVYPYLGGLLVGDQSTVHGVDPSGAWFYIANPDVEDEYCWIWGYYAETSSSTGPLPVYTPGPTPNTVPDFKAEYSELETCKGGWRVEFIIENIGPVTIESISVHVLDTITGEQTGLSEMNSFMAARGCDLNANEDLLFPGEAGYTISFDLSEDPSDHYSFATITACTQENLAGNCFVNEFAFTP